MTAPCPECGRPAPKYAWLLVFLLGIGVGLCFGPVLCHIPWFAK